MDFQFFYEYAILATTLIGSAWGGWVDLKTTEVPDSVPLFISVSALILHILNGLLGSGWSALGWAFGVGLAYLAFGYIMFYSGQWGEADVLLLAAIGFAIPQPFAFFNISQGLQYPLFFVINSFVVGAAYSIVYGVVMAFRMNNFWKLFGSQMIESKGFLKNVLGMFLAGSLILFFFLRTTNELFFRGISLFIPLIGGVFLLYVFALTIDKHAFKKKINSKDLMEGDVLANAIPELKMKGKLFVGLTKAQIRKIQKIRKTVEIKEGIRYVPAFFFTIIATILFGNVLGLLLA